MLFPLLSCFPHPTYFPTYIPSFFVSFLTSPFFLSLFRFLPTILPSFPLSALPPPTSSHHPLLPLPPFYLACFSNPFPSSYPLTHLPLCFPGSSLTRYTKSELLTGLKLQKQPFMVLFYFSVRRTVTSRPATFTQPRPQPSKSGSLPTPTGALNHAPVSFLRSTSGPSAVNLWSFIVNIVYNIQSLIS